MTVCAEMFWLCKPGYSSAVGCTAKFSVMTLETAYLNEMDKLEFVGNSMDIPAASYLATPVALCCVIKLP